MDAGLIAIACGLIVSLGALGASIGIAMVGSKYLESSDSLKALHLA